MAQQYARILIRARKLLSDPNRWTQGHLAVTARGSFVCAESRSAVKFCLLGAVHRSNGIDSVIAASALTRMLREQGWGNIAEFNDAAETTHADVLNVLDRAIEIASTK